ncbi:MAG TPA: hypothetical protein VKY40_09280 [Halanaerobiales bacterium]|nr:hypothetical protein [Halanaerobiales bacterium]
MLYPRDFGTVTAGSSNITAEGVGYHSLRIQGYSFGADGLVQGLSTDLLCYKTISVMMIKEITLCYY